MALLGGFHGPALSRYTSQYDISIGTPIARPVSGRSTEELIGFSSDGSALRTDLSGDPGFREFLQRVGKQCAGGLWSSGSAVRNARRGALQVRSGI